MTGFFESILNGIDKWVGNYGVAVILFTLLIRMVLLPLDIKSKKSMRAMSRVQPQLNELQRKYADDKDKLNKKMSELYKAEHVNPLMGCLPMLIQLPILFIMFAAMRNIANAKTGQMLYDLLNDLTAKGADGVGKLATESFLWIKNVFQPDSFGAPVLPKYADALTAIKNAGIEFEAQEGLKTVYNTWRNLNYGGNLFTTYKVLFFNLSFPNSFATLWNYANGLFILPLFAGASQLLMTKITGSGQPAPDPNNQQGGLNPNGGFMKWFFPLFSLYICASYTSAFALYWAASNIIAIVQQFIINKVLDAKDAGKAPSAESSTSK